ncbi:lytic murein transglycosylase [Patulibacter americanus]|uniref:lytic murein transglycosylase n=1 Tax=Patulibacter americanus TaxID=588672 RepID=UPI0003B54198|nr:lytic murein transglycosylase [Patulibacter americanus]
MRPQIPVLAVLAVLAIPPSLALGQDDTPAAVPSSATTTGATAPAAPATTTDAAPAPTPTSDAPAPPAGTAPAPPASTTTQPAVPAPTPGLGATPPPAFEPDLTDPDGPKLSTARPEGRETAKERRARERREAKARRARKDAKGEKGGKDAKEEDDAKKDDARTPADILAAPATGLSALSVAQFRIPPFLLPIYQAAGMQYGIRWEILAAINEIETDYGRNLNVSSAGAQGWMQFMPPTWASYGVDANGDGEKDPYNPVDAIFAAARYLKAAGGMSDVRRAVFAYNHADWYVNDVLKRARAIASLPADVVSSLTGLTLAQLPVYVPEDEDAKADAQRDAAKDEDDATDGGSAKTDADDQADVKRDDAKAEDDRAETRTAKADRAKGDDAKAETRTAKADRTKADAVVVRRGGSSTWAPVSAPEDAAVVAVQDGTITRIGEGERLGRFVEIRDAYGNSYTYSGLGTLAEKHLVPRKRAEKDEKHDHDHEDEAHAGEEHAEEPHADAREDAAAPDVTAGTPGAEDTAPTADPVPTTPATAGEQPRRRAAGKAADAVAAPATAGRAAASVGPSRPRTAAENAGGNAGRGSGTADDRGLGAPAAPAAPAFPALPSTTPAPGTTTPVPGATTPAPAAPLPGAPAPGAAPVPGTTPAPDAAPAPGGPTPGTTATEAVPAPGDPVAAVPPTTTDGVPATGAGAVPPTVTDALPPFPALSPGLPGGLPTAPPAEPTTLAPPTGLLGAATRFSTVPLWQILAPEMPPVPVPEPAAPASPSEPEAEPEERVDRISTYLVRAGDLRRSDVRLRTLKVGSRVMAGTVLGRMGGDDMRFAIRPAGEGAPRIDPRPIVAGWRLLDDASVFGHDDRSELVAERADEPDVGRLLLLSKERLQARVLADPKLQIYEAGRGDIRAGQIDRRVLAAMEFLTANGLRLTITSLKTGHSILSASGNVSAHSYGAAMDIAAVNGVTITAGTQGAGSITATTIRMLLRLQGTARPNQIISLMTFPGADNTMAMGDHADHIHVGFPRDASSGDAKLGRQVSAILKPAQWEQLVGRLAEIDNPKVPTTPSKAARKAKRGER